MSDKGHEGESSPRRSSQRTQRYQPIQPESPGTIRRNLLRLISGGIVAVVAGSVIRHKTEDPNRQPSPPNATPRPSTPENSDISVYQKKITELNQEILQHPQNFKEIAPRIGEVAVSFFCREMDYDPNAYKGKLRYQFENEYQASKANESGCLERQNYDDEFGRVQADRNELTINIEKVLYGGDLQKKVVQNYPAFSLVAIVLHELHHLTSPFLPNPDVPGEKIKGLTLIRTLPALAKPNFTCYETFRNQLEEAVVDDSRQRMTDKLGFTQGVASSYERWVQLYRQGVITRLFNGEHKTLLKLHQQTKPKEFLSLVGQRLGAEPSESESVADEYLRGLLLQGIYLR
jgi:hypothetical protein